MDASPIERLLGRLDGVKETSPGQFKALCPAHDDHNPSLCVTEKSDRVLIHCYAGCAAAEIVESVGLSLGDLFDAPMERGPIPKRDRWNERGLLVQLMPEIDVVLIAANQRARGKPLSAVDHRRLCGAHERIRNAVELVA